jgi:hypothetical protein
MHIGVAHERELRNGALHGGEFASIARGDIGDAIGADKAAAARLVYNYYARLARHMFADVTREETGHYVRAAAGR